MMEPKTFWIVCDPDGEYLLRTLAEMDETAMDRACSDIFGVDAESWEELLEDGYACVAVQLVEVEEAAQDDVMALLPALDDEVAWTFVNQMTGGKVIALSWQRQMGAGMYYKLEFDGDVPNVYGEILNNEGCDFGMWWAKAYSAWSPEGEEGLVHICDMSRQLTVEEFEAARGRGWRDET